MRRSGNGCIAFLIHIWKSAGWTPESQHLPFFQAVQAYELIQIISASTPSDVSVIVLGDINSSPDHADIDGPFPAPFETGIITPYHQFIESAFYDVWELRPGKVKGYTCCQQEDLDSQQALLTERIDYDIYLGYAR